MGGKKVKTRTYPSPRMGELITVYDVNGDGRLVNYIDYAKLLRGGLSKQLLGLRRSTFVPANLDSLVGIGDFKIIE